MAKVKRVLRLNIKPSPRALAKVFRQTKLTRGTKSKKPTVRMAGTCSNWGCPSSHPNHSGTHLVGCSKTLGSGVVSCWYEWD